MAEQQSTSFGNHADAQLQPFIVRLVDSHLFHGLVIFIIFASAVVIGLETDYTFLRANADVLHILDHSIVGFFVIEMLIQAVAEAKRSVNGKLLWYRYVTNPWHIFDILIVTVCLLPLHTEFFAVLRTARILRVFLLVDQLPRLKLLVGALLKSLPSMGYVILLLLLHFYAYSIVGVQLFSVKADGSTVPQFASLPAAMLSLFQVVTGDGWSDVMRSVDVGESNHTYVAIYFVSFMIIGAMIFLNLFIGVITNEIAELKKEADQKKTIDRYRIKDKSVEEMLKQMECDMQALQEKMSALRSVVVQRADMR